MGFSQDMPTPLSYTSAQEQAEFLLTCTPSNRELESMRARKLISLIWNRGKEKAEVIIDGLPVSLLPQQITSTTYLQHVSLGEETSELTFLSFNREFYCIQDHDEEVSCNGIIFFGTQDLPIISLDEEEAYKFDLLYQVFVDEFETKDVIQGEMLRMLLKRFIIKSTRLAKEQLITKELNNSQIDTIRKFNVLVDKHFRSKKKVADYADMLYKSPKTLANLFATYSQETPLQIIHQRVILEAKRLFLYTDKSGKEVAAELGYEDAAHFSRFFKKQVGMSQRDFQKSLQKA